MDIPLSEPVSHHLMEANRCKHQGTWDFVNCKLGKDAQRTLVYKSKQISKGQRPQISITKLMWFYVSSLWTLCSGGHACVCLPEHRMHQSEEGHRPKCWQPRSMESIQPRLTLFLRHKGPRNLSASNHWVPIKIIQRRHSLENKPSIYISVQNSSQKCLAL